MLQTSPYDTPPNTASTPANANPTSAPITPGLTVPAGTTIQGLQSAGNPTAWANQVLQDLGVQVTPNTTQDILSWMAHEEPQGQWWGGFGTAANPTRLNPLNTGYPGFGYGPDPATGNTLSGGLGTYPSLSAAAQGAAATIEQGNMSGILNALRSNDPVAQFGQAVDASPWAASHYGWAPWGPGTSEGQGPSVGSTGTPGQAGGIAGALGSQLLPGAINNYLTQDQLNQQLALSQQLYQNQADILGQNYGYSQQQFGIQQQQLQWQQQANQDAQRHLGAGYGFQQQRDVLSGQSIQAAIQNIVQNFGFQQQAIQSQGAGSGTFLTHTQSMAQQQAQMAEQYQLFGEQQAQAELGITQAEQKETYGYNQQQLQTGRQQLDLQLQSLGISEQQAQTQYQNALQQLGLGNLMSVDQLQQQIAIMAGGGYSPMSGMLGQLQQMLPFIAGAFTQGGAGG